MKLRNAPVIVDRFGKLGGHTVINRAAAKVRQDYINSPVDGGSLRKIAQDIWALDDPIGIHTDGTAKGHRVFGVVLINDPGLVLMYENVIYDLPVGTIYHIDGHRRHGALAHNVVQHGKLFAFLAWDVPSNSSLSELIDDVIPSLAAYADGEQRINILAP